MAFHLPRDLQKDHKNKQTNIFGVRGTEPRTIGCAKYVTENMDFAVSKLYIDQYFDKHARREVCIIEFGFMTTCFIALQSIELVENIRNTFIDMVNQSTWMDNISKKNTIEKVIDKIISFVLRETCILI